MVFWCPTCGAFLGLRDPLTNWSIRRNCCCPACVSKGWPNRQGLSVLEPIENEEAVSLGSVDSSEDADNPPFCM